MLKLITFLHSLGIKGIFKQVKQRKLRKEGKKLRADLLHLVSIHEDRIVLADHFGKLIKQYNDKLLDIIENDETDDGRGTKRTE